MSSINRRHLLGGLASSLITLIEPANAKTVTTQKTDRLPRPAILTKNMAGESMYGDAKNIPLLSKPDFETPTDLIGKSQLSEDDMRYLDKNSPKTKMGMPSTRSLWLINPHTKEQIKSVFWDQGKYNNEIYSDICTLMRDWRQNKTVAMDANLLHLIWAIQRETNFTAPVIITSAFRTQATNKLLMPEGAAANSQHLHSRAADIILDGQPPKEIALKAQQFGIGGVGFYKNFTHVDTARRRTWYG
jgi:uncharacterized protein YcbK (DUF882 family)